VTERSARSCRIARSTIAFCVKSRTREWFKSGRAITSRKAAGLAIAAAGTFISRLLALTEAGCGTLATAAPIWRRPHAAIEASLSDAEARRTGLRLLAWM
jgi:hypothetical protein